MEELTIYKAKSKIKQLENEINLLLERKELAFNLTQPKAKQINDISVSGGMTREDKFAKYVELENDIDEILVYKQQEILLYDKFIEKELERMNEYDEWEQKVIYMRESGKHWFKIACSVPFSERTCKRIYRKYKNKRDM